MPQELAEPPPPLAALEQAWTARWEEALALWSKFTRLSSPRFCVGPDDEEREGLSSSFAMIRLLDQAVVVSLRQVAGHGLEPFALEILAHEIGHHVYCPGDLHDHARLVARVRAGLPGKSHLAGFVANLYADLLVNDRLQRSAGLDVAGVYRALGAAPGDRTWALYMRIYEELWSLPRGSLAGCDEEVVLDRDAWLGARLVRAYAKEWLDGAGRFATLLLPYLQDNDGSKCRAVLGGLLDTEGAAAGCDPAGLTEIDDGEAEGAVRPADDPAVSGLRRGQGGGSTRERSGGTGRKNRGRYRDPIEYGQLLEALGVEVKDDERARRYYRERALPHLVPFPRRRAARATEPLAEGVETWDAGSPLERIDWVQTMLRSPVLVPGVTTVQRTFGETAGAEPKREPLDLYLGIDCSGSMPNPRAALSYPVLAGTILALSALRAGARVKVVLSGEPGETIETDGFLADERGVLGLLTSYLGTGYGFGIHRLAETFDARTPRDRPVHVVVITDQDVFSLLDSAQPSGLGWDVAKRSLEQARGGGTMVLHMPSGWDDAAVSKLGAHGFRAHRLFDWEELVQFARAFARMTYEEKP